MYRTKVRPCSLKLKIGLVGALGAALLVTCLLLVTTQSGCGEEECLVHGENCGASYKQSQYGTTDIWCCDGMSCSESSLSKVYVCK
jgi:hypothetical protein